MVSKARFIEKVRSDVSASIYQSMVRAIEYENKKQGRNDIIINRRDPPYKLFCSIKIRSVLELEGAVQREGTTFNCKIVPQLKNGVPTRAYIAIKARELGVQVDTWTN